MAKRVLYSYDPETDKRSRIATFELKASVLKVSWEKGTDWTKRDIEQNGIVAGGKVARIADGKAFYDALPLAFARNSTMYVEDA